MKQKIVTFLIFLLLPCLASGFLIKEFTASPSMVQEATAVSFNAVIEKTPSENYSFEFDFGDGTVSSSPLPHSMHSFYIQSLGEEQDFTVTLRAKNSSKILSEKTVKVTVKRSDFKPRLLELNQFPKGAEEKNQTHTITIHFLDRFGQSGDVNEENSSLISFYGTNQSLTASASIKGKEIKLKPYKGSNVARLGALVGSFKSDNSFNCIELLKINAKIAGVEEHFSIPLFFKPQAITVKRHSTPGIFPRNPIGRIFFSLALGSGIQPNDGNFTAKLFAGNTLRESKQLSFDGNSWSAFFDYAPAEHDIIQGLKLVLSGTDSHGNILGSTDSTGKVIEHTAIISLANPQQENPLKIEVIAPASKELGFGQSVNFTAKLSSEGNGTLKNAKLKLENTVLGIKKELKWNGEYFSTTVEIPPKDKMPIKASASQNFYIHAYAKLNSKEYYNYAIITTTLSKKIGITFEYPRNGITELDSNNAGLRVKLQYPDNSLVTKPTVKAVLTLDGVKKEITLTLDQKQEYLAELPQLSSGQHSFSLNLMEPFEGTSTISTTLVKPVWPLVFGVLAIIAIAAFLVFVIVSARKGKQREKIALQNRLAGIEAQLKAAKVNYFKRKITDAQYRERVLKLQQEKEQILKKKTKAV